MAAVFGEAVRKLWASLMVFVPVDRYTLIKPGRIECQGKSEAKENSL
jgi:hypothetical protein